MIRWNENTVYSRWCALILFLVALPILSFYIGAEYATVVKEVEGLNATQNEALHLATQSDELSERQILTTLYGNFNEASSSATWMPNEVELQRLYSVLQISDSSSEYEEQVSKVLGAINLSPTKDGGEMRAVLISTRPSNSGYECHACGVALGSAFFKKNSGAWTLLAHDVAFDRSGEWGEPTVPSTIALSPGPNNAFLYYESGMNQGVEWSYLQIHTVVDGRMEKVFDKHILVNNSGNVLGYKELGYPAPEEYSFSSKLFLVPKEGSDYYDIIVTATGTNYQPGGVISVPNKERYEFGDGVYQRMDSFDSLSEEGMIEIKLD